ncbi:MAG: class I mannose-6-phosphate isomerase [Nocardioidaceae bacterium]
MRPVQLAPNLIDHFYAGGARIAALRGIETSSDHQPEEWIASTVSRAGEGDTGLARSASGDLLRDLVASDPGGWTGSWADGATPAPGDTGILLKLLDAGQRLPVHVHPDRAFAARHLDCPYGKTEAWFVLDATDDAAVYLGWQRDVDPGELAQRRDAQDGAWLIDRMHRLPVRPGDGVLVPAGTPHAIGQGVFVAEVQEPTDYSILLEWSITTSTREESHLGLGFDTAMGAVSHDALAPDRLAGLRRHTDPYARYGAPSPVLPVEAEPFFRLHLVAPAGDVVPVPAGFAALVVLDGEGTLNGDGQPVSVRAGEAYAVPAGYGPWSLGGDVRLLLCRPGADWPGDVAAGPRVRCGGST